MLGAVIYPIVNIFPLVIPYLLTLVMFVAVGYLAMILNVEAIASGVFGSSNFEYLLNLGILLLFILVLAPLLVMVARHVVVSEKIGQFVVLNLFGMNELRFVISMFILLLLFVLPVVVAGLFVSYVPGLTSTQVLFSVMGTSFTSVQTVFLIGFVVGIYFFTRGMLSPVAAAVGKDMSLGNSFKLTKGHGLLILVGTLVMMSLMGLLLWQFLVVSGLSSTVMDAKALLAMSPLEKLIFLAKVLSVRLLMGIMFVAYMAKLYVVLAGRAS